MRSVALALFAASACIGCGSDDEDDDTSSAVISTYADIVHESYHDSADAAAELDAAIAAFVGDPSEATLEAAREAWLAAREPYLQTEVYRFYDGPIDNPEDGPEGLINAWPLDENYVDYVEGEPEAGIVNDLSVDPLDAETLISMNQANGEADVSTGFHAIEFLLWGQDFADDGPGARPFTDYVTDGTGTAANQERRAQYLQAVSAQLVEHLEGLAAAWDEDDADNYRAEFVSVPSDEALARILTGMLILSGFETGGERLQAALDAHLQEEEHSCFSDNTHRDMIQDVQGVKNVWRGEYRALDGSVVSGASLFELVSGRDADLADELDARIDESLDLANALQPPFDQEIRDDNPEGNQRVQDLIDSLNEQETLLARVFDLFELEVPPDP